MRAEVAVADDHGVLAVDKTHALLEFEIGGRVPEGRPRAQTKFILNVKAVREDRAGVQVRRQMRFLSLADHALLKFREQYVPLDGRAQRRDEQAVLAARVGADDRRRSETA